MNNISLTRIKAQNHFRSIHFFGHFVFLNIKVEIKKKGGSNKSERFVNVSSSELDKKKLKFSPIYAYKDGGLGQRRVHFFVVFSLIELGLFR